MTAVAAPLILALAGLVELPARPAEAAGEAGPGEAPGLVLTRVETFGAADALGERLRLFDPAPLFLPFSRERLMPNAEGLREAGGGEAGLLFSPRLRYQDGRELRRLLSPAMPTNLAMAEELAGSRWFSGLARTAAQEEAGPRAGVVAVRVKVFRFGTGQLVLDQRFNADSGLAEGGWRPFQLMMLVNEVGTMGYPSIIAGSGVDDVHEKIRGLLGRDWGRSLRLRPGNYRLEVSL